jgi:esterase/lipase superfamily enzyme
MMKQLFMASNQLRVKGVFVAGYANSENGAARVLIDLTIKDRNFNCFYHFKIVQININILFKSLIQLFVLSIRQSRGFWTAHKDFHFIQG